MILGLEDFIEQKRARSIEVGGRIKAELKRPRRDLSQDRENTISNKMFLATRQRIT